MINLDWIVVKNCPNCGSENISIGNNLKLINGPYISYTMCEDCKTMVGTQDMDLNMVYWNNIRRGKNAVHSYKQ